MTKLKKYESPASELIPVRTELNFLSSDDNQDVQNPGGEVPPGGWH